MKTIMTLTRSTVAGLVALGAVTFSTSAVAEENAPECYPEFCECIFFPEGVYFCWFI